MNPSTTTGQNPLLEVAAKLGHDGRWMFCPRCQLHPNDRVLHGPAAALQNSRPGLPRWFWCLNCNLTGTAFTANRMMAESADWVGAPRLLRRYRRRSA